MKEVLDQYFQAWRTQDSNLIASLFTQDGTYRVKPFGIEEYHGTVEIKNYWSENPSSIRRTPPQPRALNVAFGDDLCFAEWENKFVASNGVPVTTQGMMLLLFADGLIKELREHFLTAADQA